MLQLVGAFAEFERAMFQERVIAGVRRAQAVGIHCGRPKVEFDLQPALAMLDQGHGLKTTARAIGVSRTTLRQRLLEAGEWPRSGVLGRLPRWSPPERGRQAGRARRRQGGGWRQRGDGPEPLPVHVLKVLPIQQSSTPGPLLVRFHHHLAQVWIRKFTSSSSVPIA
jgi:hypothetical protein